MPMGVQSLISTYIFIYIFVFKKKLASENRSTVKLEASISELPLIKNLRLLHSLSISKGTEREVTLRCYITTG